MLATSWLIPPSTAPREADPASGRNEPLRSWAVPMVPCVPLVAAALSVVLLMGVAFSYLRG